MKSLLAHRKGQFTINMLQVFAVIIAATAIVLAITGEVIEDVQEDMSTDSKTVSLNITFANNTFSDLQRHVEPCSVITNSTATVRAWNGTLKHAVTNIDVDNATLNISYEGGDDVTGNGIQVNFTYTWYCTYSYNASDQGLQANNTFGDWLDTIALVLVAVIVIGLVAFFGRTTRSAR